VRERGRVKEERRDEKRRRVRQARRVRHQVDGSGREVGEVEEDKNKMRIEDVKR
jgi:hypothetical protein